MSGAEAGSGAGGAAALHLKVVTPSRLLVEADVDSVSLPTLDGEIGVWPGHRTLVVGIGRGTLSFRIGGVEESVAVRGGYAQVEPDRVVVMTEAGGDGEGA